MAPSASNTRGGRIRWCTFLAILVSLACLHSAAASRPQPALQGKRFLLSTAAQPEGQGDIMPQEEGQSSTGSVQEGPGPMPPGAPHVGVVPTTDRARCNRVAPGTTTCATVGQASAVLACCPPFGDQCFTGLGEAADCPEDTSAETPRYIACCH